MKAIIYISNALVTLDPEDIEEMAVQFGRQNDLLGITGYLCYHKNLFFQYIEGDDNCVSKLMTHIEKDKRHHVIRSYEDADLSDRRFPHWSMKHLRGDQDTGMKLEDLVEQHFQFIDEGIGYEQRWVDHIWGAITDIANLQKSFS